MLKKSFPILFALLSIIVFNTTALKAQTTTKDIYPEFYISPLAGVQFPVGSLNDTYKPSYNAGLDFAVRLNRETSFYLKVGYYNMTAKSDVMAPDASFIEITAGPRYIFTSPKLKAKLFLEAGLGAYIYKTKDYTIPGTPDVVLPGTSVANFGVNAGPGFILPLGKSIDLMIKSKIHCVFEKETSHMFISAVMGLNFTL
ncbi:MAG: hypothetical protein PHN88_00485 [Ignavibacteria bacterium]|nr:hypothetical protein [Ignavibacteria bacterium]